MERTAGNLVGLLALCWTSVAHAQSRLYVDASVSSSGDGTAWNQAYKALGEAISYAKTHSSVTEIWVADGRYTPATDCAGACDKDSAQRDATFELLHNVSFYGGFAGGESLLSARGFGCQGGDYSGIACESNADCGTGITCLNATILDGDLNNDDGANFANYDDNSYHVVSYPTVNAVARLDGFVVTAGNAHCEETDLGRPECLAPNNQGAAVNIRNGTVKCVAGGPTLVKCLFKANRMLEHGAVNDHGVTSGALRTTITSCRFVDNNGFNEGGALNIHSGSPKISGTFFEDNYSNAEGGAIWIGCDNDSSCGSNVCNAEATRPAPEIKTSTFLNNSVNGKGAAVFAELANVSFTDCDFIGNSEVSTDSGDGGTIWTEAGTKVTLTRCLFADNYADGLGGAIYNNNATMIARDCRFFDNSVSFAAGAIYDNGTNTTMERCLFSGNSGGFASSVYIDAGGNQNFVCNSCRFIDNDASAAIWTSGTTVALTNCLFSSNAASAINLNSAVTLTVKNSTIAYNEGRGIISTGAGAHTITVHNSILWGNTDSSPGTDDCEEQISCGQSGSNCATCSNSTLTVTYSDIEGGTEFSGANGNIASSPSFVDSDGADNTLYTGDEDYHLIAGSTCNDAGSNSIVTGVCPDLDGKARFSDDANRADTGSGTAPIVDMGAYELGPLRNNRYLAYTPVNVGTQTALRVRVKSSIDFPNSVGWQWWAQTPFSVTDGGQTIKVARLGCSPVFRNWHNDGMIYIGDEEIVPRAVYTAELVKITPGLCSASSYVEVRTEPTVCAWGDVAGEWTGFAWSGPDGVADTNDVEAVTDKVQAESFAPPLVRCDLDPSVPNNAVNVSDIGRATDAAAGLAYPYAGPYACTCSGFCEEFPANCAANCCVYGRCCDDGVCSVTVQADCAGTWTEGGTCGGQACLVE